jgi:hypothetical protein
MKLSVKHLRGREFDHLNILKVVASIESGSSVRDFETLAREKCSESEAREAVTQWNAMPEFEQSRCHLPGYALEFCSESGPILVAAICWKCNNISISGSQATSDWRTFDANSKSAKQLLALCMVKTGNVS